MTTAIKTREEDEPVNVGEFCGICQRQVSRYTCPSCNLFYCSLSCFRSDRHSQCSETFYRKEIETGIKSGPSRSEHDRNQMLELLKRMEDESAAGELGSLHPDDDENEAESLAHRFSDIDISSASTDEVLRLLNKEERNRFFTALKDPSSELARELLESAELEKTRQLPWWEAPGDGDASRLSRRSSYGIKPDLMVIPVDLIHQASRGTSLLYNICVVFLAYAYVTRRLSMSPLSSATNDPHDEHEARRIIMQSIPFVRDRKSTLLHLSLTDAVISFWSRLDPERVDRKVILVLLNDVAGLVRPRRIIATGEGEHEQRGVLTADHPFSTMMRVISDLSSLFRTCSGGSVSNHIVMKLTFYAAHVLSTSLTRFEALADQVRFLSEKLSREMD